jgi:glutamate N-acetyltransferase / amino-acid N-acetyltransferase
MRPSKNAAAPETAPRGFFASAVHAGIKKNRSAPDLTLIYSEAPRTSAAAVFTTNRVIAAPVRLSRQHLHASHGRARAVVVNSGNANACTGRAGWDCALRTASATAQILGIRLEQVLVASTGVIGVPLRARFITSQLVALKQHLSPAGMKDAAWAIMTTDTFPKLCSRATTLNGTKVRVAGIAKGSGMIHPRMATMLAFIMTDAAVEPADLQRMLKAAVKESFNRISVDGDTSTNDTVIALASGSAGVAVKSGTPAGTRLQTELTALCHALAQMIVRDGEGAKKLVTIEVRGALTAGDADRIARAVANSPLVKTALAGSDPNWGRILCAAGYSGARFDPDKVDIRLNSLFLCRDGANTRFNEAAARRELDHDQLTLRLDLHQGRASARFWTCDLTREYITINASYRT